MIIIKGKETKRHIAWTLFMKDLTADLAKHTLKELKVDRDTFTKVFTLVDSIHIILSDKDSDIRKLLSKIGFDRFRDLIYIKRLLSNKFNESEEMLSLIDKKINEIELRQDAISIAMLDIKGDDLMQLGIEKGPVIGEVLGNLLEAVLEDPKLNSNEILLNMAKELKDKY